MDLFCHYCEGHTEHTVRPWQTAPGRFGAVSVTCEVCSRMAIADLSGSVHWIEFSEDGEIAARSGDV